MGRPVMRAAAATSKTTRRRCSKKREGAIADGRHVSNQTGKLLLTAASNVVNDYQINGKRSIDHVERRIRLHLIPFSGGRRMITITTADVRRFIAERQAPITDADGTILHSGASNAEVNRELAILKRAFSLAIKDGLLSAKLYIPMLTDNKCTSGIL